MANLLLCLNSSAILKSVYKQEKESCRKPYVHLGILFTSFLKAKFPVFFFFFFFLTKMCYRKEIYLIPSSYSQKFYTIRHPHELKWVVTELLWGPRPPKRKDLFSDSRAGKAGPCHGQSAPQSQTQAKGSGRTQAPLRRGAETGCPWGPPDVRLLADAGTGRAGRGAGRHLRRSRLLVPPETRGPPLG